MNACDAKECLRYEEESKAYNCRSLHHLPTRRIHKKDEVHTAAYLHTFACTHAYVHSLNTLRTPLAQLALLDTDCAHYTRRLNLFAHILAPHVLCTHTTDAMPPHTVVQLSCLVLFHFFGQFHIQKRTKRIVKLGGEAQVRDMRQHNPRWHRDSKDQCQHINKAKYSYHLYILKSSLD